MLNEIVSLAKAFVSLRSTPDHPEALDKILQHALSELDSYTIERFERKGVKSALVYNSEVRPKAFKVLLNAHLDVIPGKDEQYVPRIKGGRLYGVGSMDMKANAACLIFIFKTLARKVDYPLALQLVTDEEIGGFNGTKYQIEKGVKADFVLTGEPTNFDIVHQAKGILWLKISARGKTAHGAYPWKGENAIWKMNSFLDTLKKKYPSPSREKWVTTVNLARIETANQAFNKIPDDCAVGLDIRYIPEEKGKILASIKKIAPKGFDIEVVAKEPPLLIDKKNEYIQKLEKAAKTILKKNLILRGAQGSSDARHFAAVGCPGIEFGPVGEGIGSDNEWVSIASLERYCRILETFLLSLS